MKYILIWIIKIYQKIPSPWHGYCKYQPTCSNYAIGVLEEFGFIKGSYLMIKRIIKCNPFSKGGYDPIPHKRNYKIMEEKMIKVVGTMFFENDKLLLDKPRKRPTYQMIGGGVESGESPIEAAIRECHEELGDEAVFDENLFELIMEFDEIATSDGVTPIHFYVFKYNGNLTGELKISDEIESFLWYESSMGEEMLSNTLKHQVIPYCLKKKLIK